MNDNTQKLVKALRSGRFKQATGALRVGDGRCCLGVACDISGLGRWERHEYNGSDLTWYYKIPGENAEPSILPKRVAEWLGWDPEGSLNGMIPHPGNRDGLSNLAAQNDKGKTFAEIADLIEKNYDYLVGGDK